MDDSCIHDPRAVVQHLFEETVAARGGQDAGRGDWSVPAHFEDALYRRGLIEQVPFVTARGLATGQLAARRLVRFRGMVQDMFDPEFYVGTYRERDAATGEYHPRHARFMDMAPDGAAEAVEAAAAEGGNIFERCAGRDAVAGAVRVSCGVCCVHRSVCVYIAACVCTRQCSLSKLFALCSRVVCVVYVGGGLTSMREGWFRTVTTPARARLVTYPRPPPPGTAPYRH
jgi:hypothetical protein